jgi:transcriptional regulator with XRE-family HTH domain
MTAPNELGDFLRSRRAGLRPKDVGLPHGAGPRRTPGLRREELAALAGLSIDYYIRLEQGKETNPSAPILDGLTQALRLDDEERSHLYALANHAAGRTAPAYRQASRVVRPGVRQLLETVRPSPAYLITRTSDVLAGNPEAFFLWHGLAEMPESRRNTIRYTFCHPAARDLFADWEASAVSTAAHLRSLVATAPDDPDVAVLVDSLLAESPDFGEYWSRHEVRQRRGTAKRFLHPVLGDFTLTFEVLHLDEGQRMSIYQAEPGSAGEKALAELAILTARTSP